MHQQLVVQGYLVVVLHVECVLLHMVVVPGGDMVMPHMVTLAQTT